MNALATTLTMAPPALPPTLLGAQGATQLNGPAGVAMNQAQIMKAAKDFESVFATQMLTPMYEGLEVDDMFGGGHGEEMFRTVLLDEYGKQMGEADTFGIAHTIADTLLRAQETR